MEQIQTIYEGLHNLFKAGQRPAAEFVYEKAAPESCCDHIIWEGERIPVLEWRYSKKYYGVYSTLPRLGELSMLKTLDFAPNTRTLAQELFREMDLAEFLLQSRVKSIMGFGTEQAANFIVRMQNGTLMNLETAVTMPAEARREVKHTVFTTNGMASDMVVDNVVVHDQIHVFNNGRHSTNYTDDDINLFGLSLEEQDTCYAIYALLDNREDKEAWKRQEQWLIPLVAGALSALRTGEKYVAPERAPWEEESC